MRRWKIAVSLVLALGCALGVGLGPVGAADVTDERLLNADKDQNNWLTYYRTYNGWRHSPLAKITPANAKRLTAKWMVSLGAAGNHHSTPLVNDGVLYVTGTERQSVNRVLAVDAASGKVLWRHDYKVAEDVSGLVTILSSNRGVALHKDRVIFGTMDAHVVALNAKTGKEVWKTKVADYKDGYFVAMAPLAAAGRIIIGTSGPGEMGSRGFMASLDPESGREQWRTYAIPGPGEPGNDTWAGESWKHGGAAVWLTGTYDPASKTVFFGVGNPAPWDANLRKGANLHTNSTLALDIETGKIKWAFQYHPNDTWDLDTPHENLLININKGGKDQAISFQPNKTGFYFSLDRATGKFVQAKKFGKHVNVWSDVNPETGKLLENPGMRPSGGGPSINICPALFGSRNWGHASYDPKAKLVYLPGLEVCMKYSLAKNIEYKRGALFIGADFTAYTPDENSGVVRAIDPSGQKTAWEWWYRAPFAAGGLVSTAGGVIFIGTLDGKLIGLDSAKGKPVFEFNVGAPVTAPPITYGVGGKQYVAVLTGGGRVLGDLLIGESQSLAYLKNIPLGGTLTVFGLPD